MLDVGCWMFDVRCSMLDVGCWMLDVGCWMLDVGCWMLDVGCSMFDVRCSMFRIKSTASMAQPIKTFSVDALRIRVYATQDDLVQDAAREAQSHLQQTFLAQGGAAAILANPPLPGRSASPETA